MLKRFLFTFCIIIALKILINLRYYFLSKKYLKKYREHIQKASPYINNHKQEIVKVLLRANIGDSIRPHVEPVGYGQIRTSDASVYKNLPNLRQDIVSAVLPKLAEAPSVFLSRLKESVNPLYWIETIIFLPREILAYLGLKNELSIKILNIIWWIVSAVLAILYGVIGNKLTEILNNYLVKV